MTQRYSEIELNLHYKQSVAFTTNANEVLYGGSAGGGKSHLMRVAAIQWCGEIPGLQCYLFRRIRDDLIKSHMEGPQGFRALLGPWVNSKLCTIVEDEIRFWNGSKIYLCHCKDEKHVYNYLSAEIHVLLIDELTAFTEKMYRFLRNRVRMVGIDLPPKYKDMFPRILCGSNPGNVGHGWAKRTFLMPQPPYKVWVTPDHEGGMARQYIPAQLEDNPSMAEYDPNYEKRLLGLGSERLVRAYRYGDWDSSEGNFFPEFSEKQHVITPFTVPQHWVRFMVIDWGYSEPAALLWFAIVPDEYHPPPQQLYGRHPTEAATPYQNDLPRNSLIVYREVYLSEKRDGVGTNKGLQKTADEVARTIHQAELNEPKQPNGTAKMAYRLGDRALFNKGYGPSISERMSEHNLFFGLADDSRTPKYGMIGGWDCLHSRFKGFDSHPMLFIFNHCRELIRVLPDMMPNEDKPEDMLSEGVEDHLVDALRYGVMSRPYTPQYGSQPLPKADIEGLRGYNGMVTAIPGVNLDLFEGMPDKPRTTKHKAYY